MSSSVISVMKFTVLPNNITIKAWLDPEFEASLSRHPKPFLLEKSQKFPREANYFIMRDTPSLKHFVVPFYSPEISKYSETELAEVINDEIDNDLSLQEFLPSYVIAKALTDNEFKSDLVKNPNKVLATLGHSSSFELVVVENSSSVYHIPLRCNPSKSQDIKSMYSHFDGMRILGKSSQCCASGTCS